MLQYLFSAVPLHAACFSTCSLPFPSIPSLQRASVPVLCCSRVCLLPRERARGQCDLFWHDYELMFCFVKPHITSICYSFTFFRVPFYLLRSLHTGAAKLTQTKSHSQRKPGPGGSATRQQQSAGCSTSAKLRCLSAPTTVRFRSRCHSVDPQS